MNYSRRVLLRGFGALDTKLMESYPDLYLRRCCAITSQLFSSPPLLRDCIAMLTLNCNKPLHRTGITCVLPQLCDAIAQLPVSWFTLACRLIAQLSLKRFLQQRLKQIFALPQTLFGQFLLLFDKLDFLGELGLEGKRWTQNLKSLY